MEVSGTLLIAIISLVLSLFSLGWQVYTWQRTGPRVKVMAFPGVVVPFQQPVETMAITARNQGRSPVSVEYWGLTSESGSAWPIVDHFITRRKRWQGLQFVDPRPRPWHQRIPYTIEGNHQETWHLIKEEARQAFAEKGLEGKPHRAFVDLGDGKRGYSKELVFLDSE